MSLLGTKFSAVAGLSDPVGILGGVKYEIPRSLQQQASLQAGVVSRQQALKAGMSAGAITWLAKSGRWQQIYPGVYATFTGSVERNARLWAIVLYCGPQARLSHQTAAELLRLSDERCPLVHVIISKKRKVKPPEGVVIHRSSYISRPWQPLGMPPHTFIEDTIIDLVSSATNLDDVIALVTTAFGRNLTSEAHLKRMAAERRKLRWRRDLDEIIGNGARGTHSVLEYRHDRDVQRAHGLPEPVRQARFRKADGTNGYRDRYYPQYGGLVIELDGKRFHPDERRGRDRERDNQAAVTGATLRYGWDDVTRNACGTAKQEAEALRNRGSTGTLKPCSPACRAVARSRPPKPRVPT
jgi:very-short-patch-repair endonuclease